MTHSQNIMHKLTLTVFLCVPVLLTGCFGGGGGNIKESYYDIKISDGISSDEAKTTALYHAKLDRKFNDVSPDSVSAQILSQGNFWRVTLAQDKGRTIDSATYLVNKINGNAKSIDNSAPPINYTSNTGSKIIEDELSPLERNALSRHEKLRELNLARNAPEKEHPNKDVEEAKKHEGSEGSVSDSNMVRAFPPRSADNKVNMRKDDDNTRIDIDSESLVSILSSNNRITAKKPAASNERPRGLRPQDLNRTQQSATTTATKPATDVTAKTSRDAPQSSASTQPGQTDGQGTRASQARPQPANTRSQQSNKTQRNIGPRFVDAFPRSGGGPTTASMNSSSGQSASRFTEANPEVARSQLSDTTQETMSAVNTQAPADPNHPVYQLKLLNEGFEKDLNNRIQLKPDHDMDFTEVEDVTDEIAGEALALNVNNSRTLAEPGETVNKIIQDKPANNVDTRTLVIDNSLKSSGSITRDDFEDIVLPAEPAAETQIASLGKPPSMAEPFFTSRGDIITFNGAEPGNKAVLRQMDEFVRDGYRTGVVPVKINDTEIRDEARLYELPPGTYTITMRCYSIYDAATNDKRYTYEHETELTMLNNHEYVIEAQTYRFDNHVECATDIFDVRDSR